MNKRVIVALLVVGALLVPAAAAMPTSEDPTEASSAEQPNPQVETAQSGGSSGGGSSGSAANYTRLYVADQYRNLELKPGQSDSFTVTVENGEDHEVTLSPHLHIPQLGERPVEKSWVTIEDADTTLAPEEEREFNVTVNVPEEAELGSYRAAIAFTNETITYPGRPPQPVHTASFNVEVYREPTVKILKGDYGYVQIQAGESYTHSVVIENTGDSAVPVNPKLRNQPTARRVAMAGSAASDGESFQRSWVEIDAPQEIQPGETVTVNFTISPPADASVGDYDLEFDLGLKDPARPDRNGWWQRIDLSFQVWKQPDQPFSTNFQVSNETESVKLTLDTSGREVKGQSGPPSFDVAFVAPNGTVIDADRTQVSKNGYVNLAGQGESSDDSVYASEGSQRTFTYRLDSPSEGEWTVRIMPHNVIQFGYEIVREEG